MVQTVAKQAAKPALKQLAKQAAKKTAKKAAQRATKRSGVRVGKRGRRWLVVVVVVVVALSPLTLLATFAAIAASVMGGMPEEMSFTGSGWSKEAERDIPAQYRALYEQAVATGCPGFPAPLLAAVGKVESDHGRGRASGIRSGTNDAGAAGPMQFLAGGPNGNTWGGAPVRAVPPDIPYGLDGNGDGTANVYDPADAIPAAARYLCAHWNHTTNGLSKAIFAYNHSDQYVDRVLQWYQTYRGPVLQPGDTQAPSLLAQKAIEIALAQVGKHYVFGTQGPNTFDCSGLTWYAYYHAGLRWTRGATTDQYRFGKLLPGSRSGGHPTDLGTLLASLQPGDLVYYDTTEPLGHMAMYLGRRNGTPMQVEAPNSRELVHVEPLGKFPVGATRPWATAAAQS